MLISTYDDFFKLAQRRANVYRSVDDYLNAMEFVFGKCVCLDLHQLIVDIFDEEQIKWERLLNG